MTEGWCKRKSESNSDDNSRAEGSLRNSDVEERIINQGFRNCCQDNEGMEMKAEVETWHPARHCCHESSDATQNNAD